MNSAAVNSTHSLSGKPAVSFEVPVQPVKHSDYGSETEKIDRVGQSAFEKIESISHRADDLANYSLSVITNVLIGFYTFVHTTRNVVDAVRGFFCQSRFVNDICTILSESLAYVSLGEVVSLPFSVYGIFHSIYAYCKGDIDTFELIVEGIITNLLYIGDNIGNFVCDLVKIGIDVPGVVQWADLFGIFTLAISICCLISDARGWHRSAKFLKEFDEAVQSESGNSPKLVALLRHDKKRVCEHLSLTEAEVNIIVDRVDCIGKNIFANMGTPQENGEELNRQHEEALKLLRGRVSDKILSHQLRVASNSVRIVASTLQLATVWTPAAPFTVPIASTLYACGGTINIAEFSYRHIRNFQFRRSILLNKNFTVAQS
ncbi:MAG: hypothetical protein KDK72_08010 [Chlamydiia bacterium]|nr:hypothetical protein [Chlamydiia bacterium]